MPFLRASLCIVIVTIQLINEVRGDKLFSVKEIFEDNWDSYLIANKVRDIELKEVGKMLSCRGLERGCFVYFCHNCKKELIVPFGCNSRICSCCGKRHTDKWADNLTKKLIRNLTYRHLVFSIPEIIWGYVKENRSLQKVLMDVASVTIKEMFSLVLKQVIVPGIIIVLHPFGKDMVFKPHVHALVTEGGYNFQNKFIKLGNYIDYNTFHKKWQYNILTALRNFIPQSIIDLGFREYTNGFYAYIKPERFCYGKSLINYIGRYIRHPAIANSRIIDYNGRGVTFYYEDNKGNRNFKTMSVFDFISAIIQHIPEKNFRLIRYYGVYSRNNIKRFVKIEYQSVIEDRIFNKCKEKRVVYCPICCGRMELIVYLKKPPPKNLNLITNW